MRRTIWQQLKTDTIRTAVFVSIQHSTRQELLVARFVQNIVFSPLPGGRVCRGGGLGGRPGGRQSTGGGEGGGGDWGGGGRRRQGRVCFSLRKTWSEKDAIQLNTTTCTGRQNTLNTTQQNTHSLPQGTHLLIYTKKHTRSHTYTTTGRKHKNLWKGIF